MYMLSRLMLLAAVLVYGYCAAVLTILCMTLSPAVAWALIILGLLIVARKRRRILALTAHGTAVWASERSS